MFNTAVFSSTCLPVSHCVFYKDHNGNKGFFIPLLCNPLYINMVSIIIIISCHFYYIMYNVFMLLYCIQKLTYLSNWKTFLTIITMLCEKEGGSFNEFGKRFDPGQLVQAALADMGQNVLQYFFLIFYISEDQSAS